MPVLLALIILALVVTFFGGPLGLKEEVSQIGTFSSQQTPQQPVKTLPPVKSEKEEKIESFLPDISVETFIKYGPLQKEIIEETNRVTFEFGAQILPVETQGQVFFETKIDGFDNEWKETTSNERTIDLPLGVGEYAFWVRAKVQGVADPTPIRRTFTIKISPYFNKVKISQVTPPTFSKSSLTILNTQFGGDEKIKITSWELKAKKGNFIIPQGVEKYDSLNPLFVEDILIKPGDAIFLSGANGPLLGKNTNFRLNKCFGYLANSFDFTIPIFENCPRPREDRLPRYLSEACQKYITSRKSCESVNSENLAKFDLLKDSICLSYIGSNFTYPGCFANYSKDSDFLINQWHIYMNKPEKEIMDIITDTVYLRDQNGLFIDKYSY